MTDEAYPLTKDHEFAQELGRTCIHSIANALMLGHDPRQALIMLEMVVDEPLWEGFPEGEPVTPNEPTATVAYHYPSVDVLDFLVKRNLFKLPDWQDYRHRVLQEPIH